jgi:hypothetical protein
MWPITFDQRLASWYNLRESAQSMPLIMALDAIDRWWQQTPWQPYYLHWDDLEKWPDPWQLLSDNVYCDVARGLGILYTITLLDRSDTANAALVLTDDSRNLVLVDKLKYILNWGSTDVVNTSPDIKIKQQLTKHAVSKKYN